MKRTSGTLRLLSPSSFSAARAASPLALSRTSVAGLLVSSSINSRRLLATKVEGVTPPTPAKVKRAPRNQINDPELLHERLDAFMARIGLYWNNKKLLLQAFTHPSYSHGKEAAHERMEFFGDRMLNFLVCEHLANKYPNLPVRAMSDATFFFTSNSSLAAVGKRLGLQDFVRWTPIEDEEDRGEPTVIAATMESLVASLYMDQGLKAAREFVSRFILPQEENLDIISFLRQKLPRNTLSELLTRRGSGAPYYTVLQESARYSTKSMFVVGVYSDSQLLGQGAGQSIVKAQNEAAQDALNKVWGEKAYTKLPADEYP